MTENNEFGHQDLWGWFGLSYASFLTLPRVLMHAMPNEWQSKMAKLLNEYNEMFPNKPPLNTRVQITDLSGNLIKTPNWLIDYRHPDINKINELKEQGYESN